MSKYVNDSERLRVAGGVRSMPAIQVRAVSGFRSRTGPNSSSARENPVGERGSTTSSILPSPIWSGLDSKKGGARNEVPQFPRTLISGNGRQLKPTFGLKVLPASL